MIPDNEAQIADYWCDTCGKRGMSAMEYKIHACNGKARESRAASAISAQQKAALSQPAEQGEPAEDKCFLAMIRKRDEKIEHLRHELKMGHGAAIEIARLRSALEKESNEMGLVLVEYANGITWTADELANVLGRRFKALKAALAGEGK